MNNTVTTGEKIPQIHKNCPKSANVLNLIFQSMDFHNVEWTFLYCVYINVPKTAKLF